MRGEESFAVVPEDDAPELPRVVEEAHEVLASYTWKLLIAGGIAILGTVGSGFFGLGLPVFFPWLVAVLLVLTVLFLAPVTREPRLARDVLRRWDQLRVERALEASGISGDPRLEVAEAMAERVLRHPSVDQRIRDATNALVRRLHRLLRDLGRVEYLTHARVTLDRGDVSRSISDLQDLLDARAAEVLGQIAELHRTVVLRDAASMERVVGGVEELLLELEAEKEVERLLSDAERD
jgi:hypothetical protein